MVRILTFILLFIHVSVFAQQKQLSLEDAIWGRYTYLNPESMRGLVWKDAGSYSYLKGDSLMVVNAKNGKETVVLTSSELETVTGAAFRGFPAYSWSSENELLVSSGNSYFEINYANKALTSKYNYPDSAEEMQFSKAGSYLAFVADDNLFLTLENGEQRQITSDGGNGIVNGKSVHRNEFGINGGIFASPNGNSVAFYRMDETMIKDYPLVDFMAREAEYTPVKYPMAGMESHHVTLGIYNIESGNIVFLKTGEPLDHYLTNVAWSPDEKYIYMAELNREQNHMQLNCYDVASGERIKTLFEEKSGTYVEPLFPIEFSKVNPNEFYYLSRQDGWFHMYKYNTDGKLLNQLTKGEWEVTRIIGFDKKETRLFVEGTLDDPLQNHIYSVDVKSGKVNRISQEEGVHSASLSPDASYVIDNWNGPAVTEKTELYSTEGKLVRALFNAADPVKDYQLGENKLVTLKTKDGRYDLYGRLILPANFDSSKKYPVIVYVYGGPHSQLVNKSWQNQARWWQYYMASQGYIAFTMDNRGTSNRGREFETAVHRQLGELETEDQMQGIDYLKSLPFVDTDRIGVHGWSYGGFMTLNLKLRHPEVFKVAVAGGPVVDWSMYEIMYGERYMDMPQDNPGGYEMSDMTRLVGNLNGKLMLIHGVQDETVVMQHSMKFLRECVKQNKQVDFFAYPTHPHNVRGKDRIHLMQKVSDYFLENL